MIRPGSIHEAILAAILLILMAILGILRVILKKKGRYRVEIPGSIHEVILEAILEAILEGILPSILQGWRHQSNLNCGIPIEGSK